MFCRSALCIIPSMSVVFSVSMLLYVFLAIGSSSSVSNNPSSDDSTADVESPKASEFNASACTDTSCGELAGSGNSEEIREPRTHQTGRAGSLVVLMNGSGGSDGSSATVNLDDIATVNNAFASDRKKSSDMAASTGIVKGTNSVGEVPEKDISNIETSSSPVEAPVSTSSAPKENLPTPPPTTPLMSSGDPHGEQRVAPATAVDEPSSAAGASAAENVSSVDGPNTNTASSSGFSAGHGDAKNVISSQKSIDVHESPAEVSATIPISSNSPNISEPSSSPSKESEALSASDDDDDIDDDAGFGLLPTEDSTSRFNFASITAGAKVLSASKEAKFAHLILNEDRDSYMRIPCAVPKKFVVIELSDSVRIDQIVIANYEFYSSGPRVFQILGTDEYFAPKPKWWVLGTFEAQNNQLLQRFTVSSHSAKTSKSTLSTVLPSTDAQTDMEIELDELKLTKYIKLRLLSHYGNEHYCTLTLLRVHGFTMLQDAALMLKINKEKAPTTPPPATASIESTTTPTTGAMTVSGASAAPSSILNSSAAVPTSSSSSIVTTATDSIVTNSNSLITMTAPTTDFVQPSPGAVPESDRATETSSVVDNNGTVIVPALAVPVLTSESSGNDSVVLRPSVDASSPSVTTLSSNENLTPPPPVVGQHIVSGDNSSSNDTLAIGKDDTVPVVVTLSTTTVPAQTISEAPIPVDVGNVNDSNRLPDSDASRVDKAVDAAVPTSPSTSGSEKKLSEGIKVSDSSVASSSGSGSSTTTTTTTVPRSISADAIVDVVKPSVDKPATITPRPDADVGKAKHSTPSATVVKPSPSVSSDEANHRSRRFILSAAPVKAPDFEDQAGQKDSNIFRLLTKKMRSLETFSLTMASYLDSLSEHVSSSVNVLDQDVQTLQNDVIQLKTAVKTATAMRGAVSQQAAWAIRMAKTAMALSVAAKESIDERMRTVQRHLLEHIHRSISNSLSSDQKKKSIEAATVRSLLWYQAWGGSIPAETVAAIDHPNLWWNRKWNCSNVIGFILQTAAVDERSQEESLKAVFSTMNTSASFDGMLRRMLGIIYYLLLVTWSDAAIVLFIGVVVGVIGHSLFVIVYWTLSHLFWMVIKFVWFPNILALFYLPISIWKGIKNVFTLQPSLVSAPVADPKTVGDSQLVKVKSKKKNKTDDRVNFNIDNQPLRRTAATAGMSVRNDQVGSMSSELCVTDLGPSAAPPILDDPPVSVDAAIGLSFVKSVSCPALSLSSSQNDLNFLKRLREAKSTISFEFQNG